MASIDIRNKDLARLLEKDGPFPLAFVQQESVPIYRVDHIHFTFLSLNGPEILLITAFGRVTTTGWTHPRLDPYVYIQPPTDGIWDFVFVAKPPTGTVADIITPISATYPWRLGSFDLKGVRVHSANNTITQMITDERKRIAKLDVDFQIGQTAA